VRGVILGRVEQNQRGQSRDSLGDGLRILCSRRKLRKQGKNLLNRRSVALLVVDIDKVPEEDGGITEPSGFRALRRKITESVKAMPEPMRLQSQGEGGHILQAVMATNMERVPKSWFRLTHCWYSTQGGGPEPSRAGSAG
jgi:hypothetical protein